jgi:annexin A7/11
MSTLTFPPVLTSPRDDAIQLHRAFKGFGCDTDVVINILAHRDATQRAYIRQEYGAMYSEDLLKRLTKELHGKLEAAILLWMHDPPGRDAIIAKQALSSDTLNMATATEVICSRTPSQIYTFKQHYFGKFGSYIEHDIEHRASGDHKKLLLAYASVPRSEGLEVDRAMAAYDANALHKAGEKRFGTDEKTFIQIFSERSSAQLAATAAAYRESFGNSLAKAVKKEASGLFEFALLTILRCSQNPAKYFTKQLHKSMRGLGTNDTALIRLIVTRTEIDMQYIKIEYQKKYRKTLNDAVHSENSGHYRTFLLSLLGPKN